MIERPPRPDPYVVLGVTRDATHNEIARAYRALARRHHPDTRAANGAAQAANDDARLRQIVAAYTVIGDHGSRAEYDLRSLAPSRPNHTPPVPAPNDRTLDQPGFFAGPVLWQPSSGTRGFRANSTPT